MQLVRYVFSYSIVIVVVVMIASAFYYREELFPNLFSGSDRDAVVTGKPDPGSEPETPVTVGSSGMEGLPAQQKQMAVASGETVVQAGNDATETGPAAGSGPASSAPAQTRPAAAAPDIAEQPGRQEQPTIAVPVEQTPVTDQADSATQVMPQQAILEAGQPPVPSQPAAMPDPVSPVPAEAAPVAAVAPQTPQQVYPGQPETERQDMETVMMARAAYWQGDYAGSEQAYQQIIVRLPDNAELHGELGNVLYAQGKWAEAASAYARVVRLLLGSGQTGQADYLIQVVASLDSALGKQLQQERNNTKVQQ